MEYYAAIKTQNTDSCNYTDESKTYAEEKKPCTKEHILKWSYLYEVLEKTKQIYSLKNSEE